MRAPRLLAVGTAAASLLLSGCGLEKPTPLVTVFSGGEVQHDEAFVWCHEGQDPAKERGTPGSCSSYDRQPKLLRAQLGQRVGVSVGKEIAEGPWLVRIFSEGAEGQGQGGASPVQEGHYFSFTPPFQQEAGNQNLVMEVHALPEGQENGEPKGIWRFVLQPR